MDMQAYLWLMAEEEEEEEMKGDGRAHLVHPR